MPTSFATFDHVADFIFRQVNPKSVLDIGCGAGKYGALAKAVVPEARRIAIEVEESYVDRFKLRDLYHEVRLGLAQDVLWKTMRETYDLVVIGDSIEHMPKSVGLDLLNFLTYRAQYILVLAPEFIIQHDVNGVEEEAHVSVWSEHDFSWHDRWAWDNCWTINLFLLRGYLRSAVPMQSLVQAVNNAAIPLTEGDGKRVIRNAELRLTAKERTNTNAQGQRISFRPF